MAGVGGIDDGMPTRKKHCVHEPPSIPSIFSCSTRRCALDEESEEDIVLVTNAHVTAETDSESMDAMDGSAPVSEEEEEPQPASADMTTATESQLSNVEVASVAMDFEDDCMPDAANIVVLISLEVSSTPQKVLDGLMPPRRQPHNHLSMLHLHKHKACATFDMPLLKQPCFCKVPDNLDVSVEQSSVELEEAVTDDASTASLAPANHLVLPEDNDAYGDETELLDPGLAVAPYPSEKTQHHIQWSLSHQPCSSPTGVPAPTILHQARYTLGAIPVNKVAIEHGR